MTCVHYVDTDGSRVQCGAPGVAVTLRCPAGRPDASGGPFCELHGGAERAQRFAAGDWNYAAPESVGDAEAVLEAGAACLRTEHAYVVLVDMGRREDGPWPWRAFLGLGTHQIPVLNPSPRVRVRANGEPRNDGRGRNTFQSLADARAAAVREWQRVLTARIDEITHMRGGTLEWGVPVEPLPQPVVIEIPADETRSAWDLAEIVGRRGREGLAAFSGLRPTGECL